MCPYSPPPTAIDPADIWTYSDRRLSGIVPSDNTKLSSDSVVSKVTTSLEKAKEIFIFIEGRWRVYFELKTTSGGTAQGQVYKNDVAWGTAHQTTSTSYVAFTEDLPFSKADLVQLYIRNISSDQTVYARYFRLQGDVGEVEYGVVRI